MASARGGWDAAAFRRQCAIPPDQLAKLNSLPGWARAMQTASLDETPDGSPTPSQQPANEVAQPRRRPARGGAFLREQAGLSDKKQRERWGVVLFGAWRPLVERVKSLLPTMEFGAIFPEVCP